MTTPNEAIARRWFDEVWNQRKIDRIDELAHEDVVFHDPSVGDVPQAGAAEFKESVKDLLAAVPDIHFSVEDVVASGDRVALRMTVTGTHQGPGLGVEPSGRKFRISGMAIGKYRDGKLIEGWNSFDLLSLFAQIGAIKRPV